MITERAKTPSRSAFIAAFAAIYLIWGSTYLGIRVAITSIPPFVMAGGRFLLAGILLLAFLRLRGMAWPNRRQLRDCLVTGILLLVGGNGLLCYAELTVPSGISALMVGVCPVFMVLTEWAWPGGHRPSATTFLGLILGFAGVVWLAAPWESARDGGLPLAGLVTLLASCLTWALGSIYAKNVRQPAPPMAGSALQMIAGGSALLVVAFLHGEFRVLRFAAISAVSWWACAYLVTIGSLVGFSTYVWLIKNSTPARVSTYAYVNPVVAVFLGWWLLDEPISSRTVLAAATIIVAVVIITFQKSKKPSGASLPPARPAKPPTSTPEIRRA